MKILYPKPHNISQYVLKKSLVEKAFFITEGLKYITIHQADIGS